jgi:hypothetical protein
VLGHKSYRRDERGAGARARERGERLGEVRADPRLGARALALECNAGQEAARLEPLCDGARHGAELGLVAIAHGDHAARQAVRGEHDRNALSLLLGHGREGVVDGLEERVDERGLHAPGGDIHDGELRVARRGLADEAVIDVD